MDLLSGKTALIFGLAGPESYGGAHWSWAARSYSPSFVAEVERIIGTTVETMPPVPSQGSAAD